jgi:hypothetical protein
MNKLDVLILGHWVCPIFFWGGWIGMQALEHAKHMLYY